MATVENFVVKVSTQGVEQLNRLAGAAETVNGKLNLLSSTIVGVGFGAFVKGAIDAADALVDLSNATGLSLASVNTFALALEAAGGKYKNTERTILSFYNALEAATDGGLRQQEAFKKVRVSLDDLRNLSETEILNKTIDGLAKLGEGSERSALAATLLGRSFRSIEPKQFAQELQNFRAQSEASAVAQEKLSKFNGELEKTFRTLQLTVADVFGPILDLFKGLEAGSVGAKAAVIGLTGAIAIIVGGQVAAGLAALVGIFKQLSNAIKGAAIAQTALTALAGPKGWAVIAGAATVAAGAYIALEKAISDANETAAKSPVGNAPGANLQSRNPANGPANRVVPVARTNEEKAVIESQRRIAQIQEETNRLRQVQSSDVLNQIRQIEITAAADTAKARQEIFQRESLDKEQAALEFEAKRTEIALRAETEIARLRAEAGRTLQEQNRSYSLSTQNRQNDLRISRESIGLTSAQADQQRQLAELKREETAAIEQARLVRNAEAGVIDETIRRIQEQTQATRELIISNTEYANSFEAGWKRAFANYMDAATNAARQAENIFNAMTSNMNSALDRFVDSGKFSFSDLTNSIIRDIIKIQLRAAAANLFSAGANFLGFKLPGRAAGGPVSAGNPYIVGEQGPEVFIPAAAGNIVPNSRLGDMAPTGGSTVVNYNIQAVDAMSFKQMVARDPSFLYAVTEQGRKAIPTTRR